MTVIWLANDKQETLEKSVTAVVGPAFGRIERQMQSVSPLTRRALEIIHARLHDPTLKPVDVRKAVGGGRGELSRVFCDDLGQSIAVYLQERRLESAQHLLVETEAPIWEVAAATGFKSAQDFSRRFRASRGHSPSQFRGELLKPLAPEVLTWLKIQRNISFNQLRAAFILMRLLQRYPEARDLVPQGVRGLDE